MCFSNLPIEFDEEGNPYLAEDADDVEAVPTSGRDRERPADDVPLVEADTAAMYDELVASLPGSVCERLDEGTEPQDGAGGRSREAGHRDPAEGD